jgi:GTP-binding protein Era
MAGSAEGVRTPGRFVSGFVSILGRPNAGKSTLLNAFLGRKLAIVSDKPQTTRTRIQGVLHLDGGQIVFLDTPGIHKPDSLMNKRMMKEVRAALDGLDVILFVTDASQPFTDKDQEALAILGDTGTPAILLLNKIDLVKNKAELLPLMDRYRQTGRFEELIPVSALTGEGLDEVRQTLLARLPEGPPYFPEDYLTDQPERFFAAEVIREKVLQLTRQEVPHATMVQVESWEETPRLLKIRAVIYVEREGQKAIVIGAQGSMLKKIGTLAREELELLLGRKIFLELFVKVRPKWREDPAFVNAIDWRG